MRSDKNKVYVGNLSWEIDSDALKGFFSEAGNIVSCIVILDRETGRSRGFGFVEFETEDEAKEAVRKFNGVALNKRNIVVSIAKPERARPKLN